MQENVNYSSSVSVYNENKSIHHAQNFFPHIIIVSFTVFFPSRLSVLKLQKQNHHGFDYRFWKYKRKTTMGLTIGFESTKTKTLWVSLSVLKAQKQNNYGFNYWFWKYKSKTTMGFTIDYQLWVFVLVWKFLFFLLLSLILNQWHSFFLI